MGRTTASLVCYQADISELALLLQTLGSDSSLSAWIVVDNSAAENPARAAELRDLTLRYGGIYLATSHNLGFGAGHNAALKALGGVSSDFHLILNPDIKFGDEVLPQLTTVMDSQPKVGLIMPRVFYPDNNHQYLCKLLPTPLDVVLRRFAPGPLRRLVRARMYRYELRSMDPTLPGRVPFLSGCFMFTRRSLLESIGGFDERYFLYMEDVDLCRRMSSVAELLYWPLVSVTHVHQRGSHMRLSLMMRHVKSGILYFNKWGWFFDPDRSRINRTAIEHLVPNGQPSSK